MEPLSGQEQSKFMVRVMANFVRAILLKQLLAIQVKVKIHQQIVARKERHARIVFSVNGVNGPSALRSAAGDSTPELVRSFNQRQGVV